VGDGVDFPWDNPHLVGHQAPFVVRTNQRLFSAYLLVCEEGAKKALLNEMTY
jgi:hypothetical protein